MARKRKPDPNAGRKSTDDRVRKRVQEVLNLRLASAETWDICQYASAQGWRISERQVRRYIAIADEMLAEHVEKNVEKLMARHKMQRRNLYARCIECGDFRTALAVARDEAELLGLYPAKKMEFTETAHLVLTEEIVDAPPANHHSQNGKAPSRATALPTQ